MKILRLAFVVGLVICSITTFAITKPDARRLLPGKGAVTGFTSVADSLMYGKGENLTKIYDGGYELYTKNGVVDAARQIYQRGKDFVEVTVHTMKSEKAALSFLQYWQKQSDIKKLTKTKTSSSFLVTKPNVMEYSVTWKYFTTVTAYYTDTKAQKDVKAFTSAVAKNIQK